MRAPVSELVRQARLSLDTPLAWLVEQSHAGLSSLWLLAGSYWTCHLAAAPWLRLSRPGCAAGLAACSYATAAVLWRLKASRPRWSVAASTLGYTVVAVSSVWADVFQDIDELVCFRHGMRCAIYVACGLYCFRVVDCVLPCLAILVNEALAAQAVFGDSGAKWYCLLFQWEACLLGMVSACVLQVQRWRVYAAMKQLTNQKEAVESLVSMICDSGGIWVARDGDTVLCSDVRFDAIMGRAMVGAQLSQFLGAGDAEKLGLVFQSAPSQDGAQPVVLVPVIMEGPGLPSTRVDLFIVDRRQSLACCCSELDSQPGFLVGIRLGEPCAMEPPAPQEQLSIGVASLQRAAWRSSSTRRRPASEANSTTLSGCEVESSLPASLPSTKLQPLHVKTCTREVFEAVVGEALPSEQARETCRRMLDYACGHAAGGALIVVAATDAFEETFSEDVEDVDAGQKPAIRTSDGGYLTGRLRGIPVHHPDFARAFREFTEHSDTDQWPLNHPDLAARGQPKDGAFLISFSGYRVKCAAKILGLRPRVAWGGVGTKHEAALACAWAIRGSVVLVRSDGGTVHGICQRGGTACVYRISFESDAPTSLGNWRTLRDKFSDVVWGFSCVQRLPA